MMKIVLLSPHADSSERQMAHLKQKGYVPLLAETASEAYQLLSMHGKTVDLAIVHRESKDGTGEPGLDFVKTFKVDPEHSDLPYVLSTDSWTDAECGNHQQTDQGANAYIMTPFEPSQLSELVNAVIGAATGAVQAPSTASSVTQAGAPLAAPTDGVPILEDAASIFGDGTSSTGIELSAPDIGVKAPSGGGLDLSPPAPEGGLSIEAPMTPGLEPGGGDEADLPSIQTALAPPSETQVHVEMPIPAASLDREVSAPAEDVDAVAAQEMPYLFADKTKREIENRLIFGQPMGDAIVPGGAAESPDIETLKKFLLLREQDVSALSGQLSGYKEQVAALEDELRREQSERKERDRRLNELESRIEGFEQEKTASNESLKSELEDVRFQLRAKGDRAKVLEKKMKDAVDETENIRERVRMDIRKIRVREKELENRLEILRRDSEALITSRESKIVELKRKLDLAEFNLEVVADQLEKKKSESLEMQRKFAKAAQAMRLAGGLLDEPGGSINDEAS